MNNSLVSINIPIYKCEKYIYRCLESVKNQTYSNIEIILVDDCTPDKSIKIIEEFIYNNKQLSIRLISHEENSGLSVVRNTGINNSNGKYIYFLDSDDDITDDCIEKLVNDAEKNNTELVIAQNRWINTFDNSKKDYGFPTTSSKKIFHNNIEIFEAYCNDYFPATSWNKLINLDFIKKNNIYFIPGLYAQDELWMFHIMEKIKSLSIINDITYNYYLHGESVIFNRTKKNFENYLTILKYIEKSFNDENNQEKNNFLKKKIINFKNMIMIMQWKALKGDIKYLSENYSLMKKIIPFKLKDIFNLKIDNKTKKKLILQSLPTYLGINIFIRRFGN